jgi:ureidoacrylate peracid hydrolase
MTQATGYAPRFVSNVEIVLPAEPEPLTMKLSQTAVIVVDMQNAYASKAGYLDTVGFDVSGADLAIRKTVEVVNAARAAQIPIIYFQNGWDKNYVEAGGSGSPNWHKSNALKAMRARPELAGKFLAKGTWDYEIVDELAPRDGDIVVAKTRYSGFFNTNVDSLLRARGIRNLVFTGIATNVCVEASLRDAFHLEYFAVVIADATHQAGPQFTKDAALYNIRTFFGWVSDTASFCESLAQSKANAS